MKPTAVAASATAAGLLLGLSLACGGIGAGSGSSDFGSYDSYTPPAPGAGAYSSLDRAYRVAPDRALVAITLGAEGPTSAEAAANLEGRVRTLSGQVSGASPRCTPTLFDAGVAEPSGGDAWWAAAELRVDVDLRTLPDVAQRRDLLSTCLSPLDPFLTRGEMRKLGGAGPERVERSAPVFVVDDPDTHRAALLDRARARLGWAAAAGGAPQLHPEDLRCVPDGTVHTADARISGVVLELGMDCRIEGAAPAPGEGSG